MSEFVSELFSLKDKVAVVTGSSRGIGRQICLSFMQSGATVIGIDKRKSEDADHETYSCNFENIEEIQQIVNKIKKKYDTIDILINNAGVGFAHDFLEYPIEDWEKTYKVNLLAPFVITQSLAPLMIKNNKGSIINITSLNAEQAFPNNPAYPAMKGGLKQLSKSFALELGKHNIRVNNIGPGYIKTKFHLQDDRLNKLN